MSVPVYKRKVSSMQYVEELYQLNVDLGKRCNNGPKKYKENYYDFIIRTGLEALRYAQQAEEIFINNNSSFEMYDCKIYYLKQCIACVKNVATTCEIFFELAKDAGTITPEKCNKNEEMIGNQCNSIIKLIYGVIKADTARFKQKSQSN